MPSPERVFIVAEAGVNHNGEAERAFQLVEAAAAAGADAVKFQTFAADRLATADAPKAGYQTASTGGAESQRDMLRRLELPRALHADLAAHARARGIEFMSTPFDAEAARFLATEIGVRRLKVPSGEITNGPLLLELARTGLPIILSTGMSTLDEIRRALAVLAFGMTAPPSVRPSAEALETAFASRTGQGALAERVTILQCTSEYPAPPDEVNLRAMDALRDAFALPVGLSDHSLGIAVAIAAAARGACAIEKHFTLDRSLPGPDHAASLAPQELGEMVAAIRTTEQALGCREKRPTPSELANRPVVRRSLVATRPIAKGETLTEANLGALRPGTGIDPMRYWDYLGAIATRDYEAGEQIQA